MVPLSGWKVSGFSWPVADGLSSGSATDANMYADWGLELEIVRDWLLLVLVESGWRVSVLVKGWGLLAEPIIWESVHKTVLLSESL